MTSPKIISVIYFLSLLFISHINAQEQKPLLNDSLSQHVNPHQKNIDPRYSVFGPPQLALWKFQLAHMNSDNQGVSSFNFYRKDQRDRTLFLTMIDNGLDNTTQYRVQQIS